MEGDRVRWIVIGLLFATGCDDYITPAHPTDQVYEPTWDGMQQLFADHCNECHGVQNVYPRLPGDIITDIDSESGQLVVPGSPGDSRIWRTISGHVTGADYAAMPLGGPLLPEATADTVAEWITNGADLGDDDPCAPEDALVWYPDADGDTFGSDEGPISACDDPSTEELAYTPRAGDCNDNDAAFFPGAEETSCTDTNDYNCDGSTGAQDNDEDGFFACEECDDTDPDVNPDAPEVCNGIDDDCDRAVDDSDDDVDTSTGTTFFEDNDRDGFGTTNDTVDACVAPDGFADNSDDCDDAEPTTNPGISQDGPLSDGIDNDCDDAVDEDATTITWTADVQPIMQANCVECHGNWGNRDFLLANTADGFDLIDVNNSADSYIYMKISNDPRIQGSQMPRGRTPLSDTDQAIIAGWIDAGAPL